MGKTWKKRLLKLQRRRREIKMMQENNKIFSDDTILLYQSVTGKDPNTVFHDALNDILNDPNHIPGETYKVSIFDILNKHAPEGMRFNPVPSLNSYNINTK